ncbi:MAG: helix-turn-helix domain-containing protein [bacterium]
MAGIPDKPTFGVRAAAEILGVSPSTVYEALYRKELGGFKVGSTWRVPRSALLAFMGIADDANTAPHVGKRGSKQPEPEEWTYIVTVRRVPAGQKVRTYPESPCGR